MKLKAIISSMLIFLGSTSNACEENIKKPDVDREKKPRIAIRGSLIKSLTPEQKLSLFKSLQASDIIVDKIDWEDIDIDDYELDPIAPLATIPTNDGTKP